MIKTITHKIDFGGQFHIGDKNSPIPGDLIISISNVGFKYITKSRLSEDQQDTLKRLLKEVFKEICEENGYSEGIHEE